MHVLAQTYGNTSSSSAASAWAIYSLILFVIYIIAVWRVFVKAGQPGWAAIIPIYDLLILLKVVGRPWWWIFLFLIPIVNLVVWIIVAYDLSLSFGHGVGFTIGLIIPVVSFVILLILGFGADAYRGPRGEGTAAGPSGGFGGASTPPPPPPPAPTV
jgi:hypothetical protein